MLSTTQSLFVISAISSIGMTVAAPIDSRGLFDMFGGGSSDDKDDGDSKGSGGGLFGMSMPGLGGDSGDMGLGSIASLTDVVGGGPGGLGNIMNPASMLSGGGDGEGFGIGSIAGGGLGDIGGGLLGGMGGGLLGGMIPGGSSTGTKAAGNSGSSQSTSHANDDDDDDDSHSSKQPAASSTTKATTSSSSAQSKPQCKLAGSGKGALSNEQVAAIVQQLKGGVGAITFSGLCAQLSSLEALSKNESNDLNKGFAAAKILPPVKGGVFTEDELNGYAASIQQMPAADAKAAADKLSQIPGISDAEKKVLQTAAKNAGKEKRSLNDLD